ncbi:nuclear intron maturase 4, mitochondrial isoform X1 [Dendrobium catenatum]|nr:nuclear intron maturase 4, mitochondrial isoform X1 [Dendrobium catenatum]XP_020684895.1 nuclear intron maturase 4, mitochondrial isoform X1 [Dendrobium catenatum]
MWFGMGRLSLLMQKKTVAVRFPAVWLAEKIGGWSRHFGERLVLEDFEDSPRKGVPTVSLAKSLACLTDEPLSTDNQNAKSPSEQKRLIEVRIKKMVKARYLNEKFYDLMDVVIANADTLRDCYDLVRLNSHVELTTQTDNLCFSTMAKQITNGDFDIKENSVKMYEKSDQRQCLVLPNLKLRVIQEAVRVVLEVVYRPYFSKISHGCRSGRGHRSALRYVQKEIHNSDWWFTISMRKVADINVLSKLISVMEEKIQDFKLFKFIYQLFDAQVLNLVFGVFPKGHGLPQEGVLSPILMNIYLGMFDSEVTRMSLRYEGLGLGSNEEKGLEQPKLRWWFRRQIKKSGDSSKEKLEATEGNKLNVCRYMDEILVLVSGSRDVAMSLKSDILNFLMSSLHLDVENQMDPLAVDVNSHVLQFLGTSIQVRTREAEALRAVHKLKDKVQMFVSQKQEVWDSLTVRIGKKWLGWGLRRIKESEIKQLGLSTPILDHLSQFRKPGMKTDHWFKSLMKIWMQDVNAKIEADEEAILSKYIVEPVLPQDLRESFYNFRKHAMDYVSSESATTLELLKRYLTETRSEQQSNKKVIALEAPTSCIKSNLLSYGIVGLQGYPKHVSSLVLQDDELIICWFSGLIQRWLKWYSEFENFGYIKLLIIQCVRKSCTRTLGAKYQVPEELIEKNYDSELSCIPITDDLETEMASEPFGISYSFDNKEALSYGTCNSGLCLLSLSRVKVPSRVFNCFVMGCAAASPSMYTLHVKGRQRFPGWKTGFSSSIHPSLNRRRIGLCNRHVKALYLGQISLQSVEFGVLRKL